MRLQEMINRIRRIPFVRNSAALGCNVVPQTLGRGDNTEMYNAFAHATSRRTSKRTLHNRNTTVWWMGKPAAAATRV